MTLVRKLFVLVAFTLLATLSSADAQTITVPTFKSLHVREGGTVILRQGQSQQVTLLKGGLVHSSIATDGQGTLVVQKCKTKCPRGYVFEVEVVSPELDRLAVSEGGTIESRGSFSSRMKIDVEVDNGGVIDVRSIAAKHVNASVREGGGIFTTPQVSMNASVVNGGVITYWGNAEVKSSIKDGGNVTRGNLADLNKSLSELNPEVSSLPPIPPLPPVPPQP
jgi:hypothetical protein